MRYLLIVTPILFMIISCDNSYKHDIKFGNLQTDLAFFQDKKNELNEIQNEFIRYLSTYDQNPEIKTFVNLLNDNNYTYSRFFAELAKFNNEVIQLKDEKDKLFKAIDDTCNFIQQKVDVQNHLCDSMNSIVRPKINIARKTIWDKYLTVVEIDSRIYNYSHNTVNYLSFDYILKKNDSLVFKIPCEVELPIENNLQKDFIFDAEVHAKIYQTLESIGLPFYSADYQVKKIVFTNGKTLAIDEKYYANELYADKQYISPSIFKGQCPYLTSEDRLIISLDQLNRQVNAFINKAAPSMSQFLKYYIGCQVQ